VDNLLAQDFDRLPHAAQIEWLLKVRWLRDRLELQWLRELSAVDARGIAGAEQGKRAASTAAWLQDRLHMDQETATNSVRMARALFPDA
jgi:hypothetical protein